MLLPPSKEREKRQNGCGSSSSGGEKPRGTKSRRTSTGLLLFRWFLSFSAAFGADNGRAALASSSFRAVPRHSALLYTFSLARSSAVPQKPCSVTGCHFLGYVATPVVMGVKNVSRSHLIPSPLSFSLGIRSGPARQLL